MKYSNENLNKLKLELGDNINKLGPSGKGTFRVWVWEKYDLRFRSMTIEQALYDGHTDIFSSLASAKEHYNFDEESREAMSHQRHLWAID